MTWRNDVLAIIRNRWRVGEEFTLRDLYQFEGDLSLNHPANTALRPKIRQTLQSLRRELVIEFVDHHGTYRRRF